MAIILLLGDERFVIVGEGHERGPGMEGTMLKKGRDGRGRRGRGQGYLHLGRRDPSRREKEREKDRERDANRKREGIAGSRRRRQ